MGKNDARYIQIKGQRNCQYNRIDSPQRSEIFPEQNRPIDRFARFVSRWPFQTHLTVAGIYFGLVMFEAFFIGQFISEMWIFVGICLVLGILVSLSVVWLYNRTEIKK